MSIGKKKIILAFLFAAMLAIFMMSPCQAMAEENQASETGSITVNYPAADVTFHLYYIGATDNQGSYILEAPYDTYNVDLGAEGAADMLAAYVVRDSIASDETALTDEEGVATFSNLGKGVYLIFGDETTIDSGKYTSVPTLVEIPNVQDSKLVYDVVLENKWTETAWTELSVVKIWENDDKDTRPESIVVQLTRDGKVTEEVTLSADNNWTCKWENLDPQYTWNVLEKEVPDGYVVSRETEKTQVAITNSGTSTDKPESNGKLPQTGQLWWPVSALLVAGLVMVLVGLLVKRKDNEI